jgi:hypothetical protein
MDAKDVEKAEKQGLVEFFKLTTRSSPAMWSALTWRAKSGGIVQQKIFWRSTIPHV